MGYTHYFRTEQEFTSEQWEDVKKATNTVVSYAQSKGILLQSDDENNPVIVDDNRINLNSRTNPHETFLVSRTPSRDFCKTNRKSYDVVVGTILLYLKKHYPDNFSFSSDGGSQDWQEAVSFANEVFKDVFEDYAPS